MNKHSDLSLSEKNEILSPLVNFKQSHEQIDSVHKQRKNFMRFRFVEPEEYYLDENDKVVYISIIKSLEVLLGHNDVFSYIMSHHNTKNGIINNFQSGSLFNSNILFKTHPHIALKLYLDDFQVVNPLGNKTKIHKICAFYWTLANIPSYLQSKIHTIQVALLAHTKIVKKHGFEKTIKCLVNDLILLENKGISIKGQNIFGTVVVVIADNLAAHELGGYFESFSAFKSCRFCNATKITRHQHFSEEKFELTSKESYNAKISQILENPSLSTAYGLKSNCTLNNLKHFHVSWGSPSDIAHDIFEGFNFDILKVIIQHCIELKYFKLDELNDRIEHFPFNGNDKTNKPSKIFADKAHKVNVKQTAAQSLCLVRILPLLIGNYVDEEDIQWQLFCMFLNLLDYILAPALNFGEIHHMRILIEDFLKNFFLVNSQLSVKPKTHFMIHYPTQYKVFGPLIFNSTLRFEGKHAYMKSIMKKCKNFKNPLMTIARRHQFLQCHHHITDSYLGEGEIKFSCIEGTFVVSSLPVELKNIISPVVSCNSNIVLYKKVTVDGISYSSETCIIIGWERDSYLFGNIKNVTSIDGKVLCLGYIMSTINFCIHLHGNVLEATNKLFFISTDKLLSPHPLPMYPCNNDKFIVVLKHHVQTDSLVY